MSNTCSSACNVWRKGIVFATAIALGGWAIMTALDRCNTPLEAETVEICVAAQDIPIGTSFTREDIGTLITRARVAKVDLPPEFVDETELLVDKRLTRPMRKGEVFNPQDLVRASVFGCLPPWREKVTIQYRAGDTFVTQGDRVTVIAKIRRGNELERIVLARNGLVVEDSWGDPHSEATVSVEGEAKELIEVAQARGCDFSLTVTDLVQVRDSEPVAFKQVKQLLESLPVTTPTEP
jgi:hypothetical protein